MNFPFSFNRVGRWWEKNSEIDIVALDSGGQILLKTLLEKLFCLILKN